MREPPPAVFVLGPTASGKTAVALELAGRFPVEIVSVDSALVYRGMDVGTAKPDAATLARHPHHLVDIVEPTDAYSAGRFRADAMRIAAQVAARGLVPLFVGGTMLYERALMRGLATLPPADAGIRAAIEAEARERGWPALHAELARGDPETAARLEPADAQRVQRALEVLRVSGRPLSDFHAREERAPAPFEALAILLEPSRREKSSRFASATRSRRNCRRCAPWATGRCGRCWRARRAGRRWPSGASRRRANSPSAS